MKTARAVIVWALLPLAIAGALVLSAAATIGLAEDAGVPARISPAAVGMLEIVSLTGTLLWVFVGNASLRRDAVLATVAASLVSLVAGFHAYGLFGAVAPLALVGVVHLASRAWREDWAVATEPPAEQPQAVQEQVEPTTATDAVSEPVEADEPPDSVEGSADVVDIHRTPQAPRTWKHGLPKWKRAVQDARSGRGRPTLMKKHSLTTQEARHVLDAVKKERAA